eukprot:3616892-Heterocapsa_arctica.AAC.1
MAVPPLFPTPTPCTAGVQMLQDQVGYRRADELLSCAPCTAVDGDDLQLVELVSLCGCGLPPGHRNAPGLQTGPPTPCPKLGVGGARGRTKPD